MKQCKALLKKEWDTNWFMTLIPLWATCIVYITALIGWIISLIRGYSLGAMVNSGEILTGYSDLVLYGLTSAITIMLGFVSAISAVVLAYNVINGGYKNRCEDFPFFPAGVFPEDSRQQIPAGEPGDDTAVWTAIAA